jgi:VWFA-related protein
MIPPRRTGAWLAGTAVSLVVFMLISVGAGRGTTAQNTTRETRDRHVLMTVLDRNDTPVTDLTAAEVVVREDGAVREIARVGRATAPMQIVLLVDDSQATSTLTNELRQAFTSFVRLIAKDSPDSELSLMTFGERPTRQVDFTSSAPVLTRAIGSVFPRSGTGAYLLQALVESSKALKKRAATRPIIVALVAEGGPEFSNNSQQNVADALKNAGAALWTVVLQSTTGVQNLSVEQRERAAVITDVAVASGGGSKPLLDKQALEHALATVATWLTSQVDVTYARPDRLIPPTRLEVTVTRPGLRVWAPRWAGQ